MTSLNGILATVDYEDDTFMVWPHEPDRLENVFIHFRISHPVYYRNRVTQFDSFLGYCGHQKIAASGH
jgi:hypothetical protein